MRWHYFLFQLKTFFTNPKNIGLYIVTALLSVYFGLVSVPNHHVINSVDHYAIKREYKDDIAFLKVAKKEYEQANKVYTLKKSRPGVLAPYGGIAMHK